MGVQLLQDIYLFKDFPPKELDELSGKGAVRTFNRDDLIFSEGDKAQSLFVIRHGTVHIRHSGKKDDVDLVQLGTLVARVAVGKVAADVTQRDGTEQGIGNRMQQGIGVGMPEQAGFMGNLDTAENQLAARDQAMHVVALPDPKVHFRPLRISAARTRSAG